MIFSLARITLLAVKESLASLSNSLNHHRKRTLAILALSASFTALLGFAALAGQGPSQWCSDNVGYEEHILNNPATFNVEAGGPVGPQGWSWIVCFSDTGWGQPDGSGGAVWFGSTQGTSGGTTWVGCGSDNDVYASSFSCNDQVGTDFSNPTNPIVNPTVDNWIDNLHLTIPTVGVGTDNCAAGTVAVSIYSCANGEFIGISGTGGAYGKYLVISGSGCADGRTNNNNPDQSIAISGTGCAWGGPAAISGTGSTAASNGIAASGAGCSSGRDLSVNATGCANGARVNISGTGDSNGYIAISGIGNATSNNSRIGVQNISVNRPGIALTGTGNASSYGLAVSGIGTATSWGGDGVPGIAISGINAANGRDLAVSGTGCASGNNPSTGIFVSTYCAGGGFLGIGAFGGSGGQIAASGTSASGGLVAISPGSATGGSVLKVSGADRRVGVLGVEVPWACEYGFTVGIGVGCGGGGPAGRPSQWCADGYVTGGKEGPRVIHDPATLDFEQGADYLQTCYSTGGYNGGGVQVVGGVLVLNHPVTGIAGLGCAPDPAAMVQLQCQANIFTPGENPLDTVAGYSLGANVTALGTPVSAPGTQIQAGTGCASGIVAVSTSSCANGGIVGVGGLGSASGNGYSYNIVSVPGVAASGTGGASAGLLAISGTGCTGGNDPTLGSSISGTNCAWGGPVGISALGSSGGGVISVGGTGCSYGSTVLINATGCTSGGLVGISGTGNANGGQAAVSGTGCASGTAAVGLLCGAPIVGDPLGLVAVGPTHSNNPNAAVAVANGGTATGSILAANTFGQSNSSLIAASPLGGASGSQLAVSGTGCSTASPSSLGAIALSATGCSGGWTAISGTNNSSGNETISGTGNATGPFEAISLAGNASGGTVVLSGLGNAQSSGWGSVPGIAIAGRDANGRDVGVSGIGNASGISAVSGAGDSNAGWIASLSGIGDAYGGTLAISGLGMASSSPGGVASVAIAGGKAVGRDLAVSGTSDAEGTVAISGTGSSRGTVAVSPADTAEGGLVGVSAKSGATGLVAVDNDHLALQVKFRVEFGLIPDASYVQALIANPPSNNSQAEFGAVLTNAELAEMQRRVTVGEPAHMIHDDGLASAPNEYSGSYIDHLDGGKIKVGFTGNLSQHLSRIQGFFPYPDQVRVVQMQFSYRYLESLRDTIENSIALLRSHGLTLVATGIDEELNKVTVDIATMNSAQKSFLLDRFGPAVMPTETPPPAPNHGRTTAWTPVRGGIKITGKHPSYRNIAGECTLGFISGDWAITAAHCAIGAKAGGSDIAQDWWQPCILNSKSPDGKNVCPNPGRKTPINVSGQATRIRFADRTDVAAFPLKSGLSSNYVYINEREPARQISGYERWPDDRPGHVICKSGITTGYPPCGKLKDRDKRFSWNGVSFRSFRWATTCSDDGDSGGPVLHSGKAKGITWGSSGRGSCPEGQGQVYYSHIDHVLNALGLGL